MYNKSSKAAESDLQVRPENSLTLGPLVSLVIVDTDYKICPVIGNISTTTADSVDCTESEWFAATLQCSVHTVHVAWL